MIQKDNYVLICIKKGSDHAEIIYPQEPTDYLQEAKYFSDYKDVEKFIETKLGFQFCKIFICKIVDCVGPTLIKKYE